MAGSTQHITIRLLPPDPTRAQAQLGYDGPNAMVSPPQTACTMDNENPREFSSYPILPSTISPQYSITLRSTYRSTSITLAQVAFFGASLAYANLFNYVKPHPVLIAWAASSFVVGAVGAGTMSFFGQLDRIWKENGQTQNSKYTDTPFGVEVSGDWLVVAYGWISCSLVMAGLALLSLSMVFSTFNMDSKNVHVNKPGIISAGLFGVIGLLVLSLGALYVRYGVKSPAINAIGYRFVFLQQIDLSF